MTDQPVTPDRETLIRTVAQHVLAAHYLPDIDSKNAQRVRDQCWTAVDALQLFLTDALDRARQQGESALTLLRQVRPLLDEALDKQEGASPYLDGGRMAVRDAAEAARLIDASHLLDDGGQQQ